MATETSNQEPDFSQESYSFSLAETAASGAAVGTVSAIDEDTNASLTYAIEGGNVGDSFSVNESTGAITVAGPLTYLTVSSYTLTLSVSDGRGGEDTATVTITLESACSNGTVISNPESKPGSVADCVILFGTQGVLAGTGSLDWSADTAITSWEGVRVSNAAQRVTMLLLDDRGLAGVIPSALGGLSALTRIDLDVNSLTGSIPEEMGDLSNLAYLCLPDNYLTGNIPSRLGDLSKLQFLYLADNSLSGSIPTELGNLWNLETLNLATTASRDGCLPPSECCSRQRYISVGATTPSTAASPTAGGKGQTTTT